MDSNVNMSDNAREKNDNTKYKSCDIDVSTPLGHLMKLEPLDIEFNDITYSVPMGRKGKWYIDELFFISKEKRKKKEKIKRKEKNNINRYFQSYLFICRQAYF